jgi:hypothetical protein
MLAAQVSQIPGIDFLQQHYVVVVIFAGWLFGLTIALRWLACGPPWKDWRSRGPTLRQLMDEDDER